MKAILYCIFICFISIYATCNKRIDCKQTIYSFEGFYKAYPDRDSIRINDTVWLELTTPMQLKDVMSGQTIDYSGARNLGAAIGYGELTGGDILNPGGIAAANSFENVLVKGTVANSLKPDQIREFLFVEENGMYRFKVGIVPKKKGIFVIGPGNAAGVYTRRNECDKASFSLTFKDTNQHLYLYEQNRPGYTPSTYEQEHMYCFKVY